MSECPGCCRRPRWENRGRWISACRNWAVVQRSGTSLSCATIKRELLSRYHFLARRCCWLKGRHRGENLQTVRVVRLQRNLFDCDRSRLLKHAAAAACRSNHPVHPMIEFLLPAPQQTTPWNSINVWSVTTWLSSIQQESHHMKCRTVQEKIKYVNNKLVNNPRNNRRESVMVQP